MSNPGQQTPPGWYADGSGAMRWWDGYRWTQHAQAAVAAPGAAGVAVAEYPKVREGTPVYTKWIWWVVALPIATSVLSVGYVLDVTTRMFSMMSRMIQMGQNGGPGPSETSALVAEQMALIFSPWYFAILFGGIAAYALQVLLSYFDHRDLEALGYAKPFHWAWSFLSMLVYVIGRSVVVGRRNRPAWAPMWVTIITQAIVIVVMIVWSVWFTNELMLLLVSGMPSSV